MLSNEGRMVSLRRLPSIIRRIGGCQPLGNEPCGMFQHGLQPLLTQVIQFCAREPELAAKC